MQQHEIARPLRPCDLLRKMIADGGWSLDAQALHAGMSTRRLRKLLDGKPLRLRDLEGLAVALGRFMPALAQELADANCAVRRWHRADAALLAERLR